MAKRPPRADRRVNGDISVDLQSFLQRLSRAVGWEGDQAVLGQPGSYAPGRVSDTPARKAVDYLFEEIMSKFDDESAETDALKTEEALVKFRQAEGICAESNIYFNTASMYPDWFAPPDTDPDVWQAMCLARRKIAQVLGPFDWNEAASGFRFTAGASFGMPRTDSTPAHKYSNNLEITEEAEALADAALQFYPAWGTGLYPGERPSMKIVEGNRLLCVPKSYKVHRVIAAEPSGNMFFQKGIGTVLRRRLKAMGVDLRSQRQNQDWALFGACTGAVATIDLSMASDTVSKGVVEWAIPPDWVKAMSLCRSPKGKLPSGEQVLYRKWSSMGNAYTFELETMLFVALTWACARITGSDERFLAAYGDDIVCSSGASDLLIRVLRKCGFVPNEKKSFVSGPFRESCGKHYFLDADVSPFYIRRQPRQLTDLFLLANNLERWRRRVSDCLPDSVNEALRGEVRILRSYAPSPWRRPRIPDNYGDGAFIGTFDECLPQRPRGKWLWWEGWQVEVIADRRKRIKSCDAQSGLTEVGVLLAMRESSEGGNLLFDEKSAHWWETIDDALGAVLPNRRKRFEQTTMIVSQF